MPAPTRRTDTMDALYLLVPLSVLGMLAILALFAWALQGGQFDEIEQEGARILEPQGSGAPAPTAEAGGPVLDAGQAGAGPAPEESRVFESTPQHARGEPHESRQGAGRTGL